MSIALELFAPERHIAIFFTSVLAILPLAAYMGRATETLAEHLGGGIGGLLNATFGNAAELIIGALALRAGLTDLVKASLTGSIIGNVLLVFGAAALVGGLRHPVQRFNRTAAGTGHDDAAAQHDRPRHSRRLPPAVARRAERAGARARHRDRGRAVRHLLREPGVHAQDASRRSTVRLPRVDGVPTARRRRSRSRGTGSPSVSNARC